MHEGAREGAREGLVWQHDPHDGLASGDAFDGEFALVQFYQALGNGEAEARTLAGFGVGVKLEVGPNVGDLVGGHALAIVDHVEGGLAIGVGAKDFDRRTRR